MVRRLLQHTMVQDVTHAPRLALGVMACLQAVWTNSTAYTRLRLPNVPEAWGNAKLLRQVCPVLSLGTRLPVHRSSAGGHG